MPAIRHAILPSLCCAAFGLGLLAMAGHAQGQSLGAAGGPTAAIATPSAPEDVLRLMRAGQLDEAGALITNGLENQPGNPQLRFLKGMLENERGLQDEAYTTFQRLTQDFPELPEPYNNLAVLEAARNRLPEALALLEAAIRLNPDYATAHQNLGDIHARLAARSYARALTLDPGNPVLRPRITTLDQLLASPVATR